MKRISASIALFMGITSALAQPTIPNSGFENWTTDSNQNLNPDYWQTMNDTPNVSVDQYTPAHSGNYAMRVRPLNFGTIVPGIAILDFKMTGKPSKLTGWVKSMVSNDKAVIYVMFYHNDSVIASPANCTFHLDSSYTSFTAFELPINYLTSDAPDSCTIVIVAGDFSSPKATTEVIIDDLSFSNQPAAIVSTDKADLRLFPNPALNILQIQIQNSSVENRWIIFDMQGKLVKSGSDGNSNFEIPVHDLSPGQYFFELQSNTSVTRQKFALMR